MQDETGRYWLVYNGEIFNYRELRSELEESGVRFHTQSDSEVVLQAFIRYGRNCLQKLNGFFAFALYDQQDHRLFAARDRMGIKPIYYCLDETGICFGSELSAVQKLSYRHDLSSQALHLYFRLTYIPAPHTMIDGIEKLLPGHFIDISQNGKQIEKYFHWQPADVVTTFDDSVKMVRSEVERSVKMRLVADVPLGTFLSGGIDSSIISAIAAKHTAKLETFSVGFPDSAYQDESEKAVQVARHIGSRHHKIMVSNSDLQAQVNDMLNLLDEPFADSSALAVFTLCKYTSQRVKVALSGDGADELFGGYRKHRALIRSTENSFINRILKIMHPLLNGENAGRSSFYGDTIRKIGKYSKGLNVSFEERYWNWLEWTSRARTVALLKAPEPSRDFENAVKSGLDPDDLNTILTTDLEILLPNDMLTKTDRMSMAHGLEVRTPFLDHELVQKVRSLPFGYKCNRNTGKILLRKAFEHDLPKWVFDQPKKGFEIPVEQLLRKELKTLVTDFSEKQLIERQAVFNYNELQQIINGFYRHNQNQWAVTLWSFLVFQNWWLRQQG